MTERMEERIWVDEISREKEEWKADNPGVSDTEETARLKQNFGSIAPWALVYSVFYAFCMYRNGSGITFPFFVAGSLLFFGFSLSKLGITLKKGSCFYIAAMMLLGVSTFCTDDGFLIFFNKLGIFLLLMSLLLKQFYNTSGWTTGKYLASICTLVFTGMRELGRPVSDGSAWQQEKGKKTDKRIWYFAAGLLVGIPMLLVVLLLLASADVLFRQMAEGLLGSIRLGGIFNIFFRITVLFFCSYALIACLCRRRLREEVPDRRKGEPVTAITVTGLLTFLYLVFSGIQIGGLFLGRMQLPEGYTYAMYAREGFFQLLAVSMLNLVIVQVCLAYFRENRVLKGILTVMSLCTFVMIASSGYRMILYIRCYSLTYLRILVLWGLVLLALLFAGVVAGIFRKRFPLFRYQCAVVAVLYIALSFAHPDYWIAKVNVADFHSGETDYGYLGTLSADAAPVLIPWMEKEGYRFEAFYAENAVGYALDHCVGKEGGIFFYEREGFGYSWMGKLQMSMENFGIRTYNVSRYLAWKYFHLYG